MADVLVVAEGDLQHAVDTACTFDRAAASIRCLQLVDLYMAVSCRHGSCSPGQKVLSNYFLIKLLNIQ